MIKIKKDRIQFNEQKLKFLNNHYLKSKNSQDILKIINDLYSNKLKIHSLNQDNQVTSEYFKGNNSGN